MRVAVDVDVDALVEDVVARVRRYRSEMEEARPHRGQEYREVLAEVQDLELGALVREHFTGALRHRTAHLQDAIARAATMLAEQYSDNASDGGAA